MSKTGWIWLQYNFSDPCELICGCAACTNLFEKQEWTLWTSPAAFLQRLLHFARTNRNWKKQAEDWYNYITQNHKQTKQYPLDFSEARVCLGVFCSFECV